MAPTFAAAHNAPQPSAPHARRQSNPTTNAINTVFGYTNNAQPTTP
ncbi:hypothetical protein ACFQ9X_48420 [Catenulispora yoronensis]